MRQLFQLPIFNGKLSFLFLPFYLFWMSRKYGVNGIMRVQINKPVPGIDEGFVVCTKEHYYKLLNGTLTGMVTIKLTN